MACTGITAQAVGDMSINDPPQRADEDLRVLVAERILALARNKVLVDEEVLLGGEGGPQHEVEGRQIGPTNSLLSTPDSSDLLRTHAEVRVKYRLIATRN